MNLITFPKVLIKTVVILASSVFSTAVLAHSAGATLGASGTTPNATALAAVTCFDDGNGEAAGLFIQIKDLSAPEPGQLISLQLYKGIKAISITDNISGDADYSEGVQLNAGGGLYNMIIDKTDISPRRFDVIWHCLTADGTHTGTDITVRQFQ